MNARKIQKFVSAYSSLLLGCLYIPHVIAYITAKNKSYITKDLELCTHFFNVKILNLIANLHNNRYYRSLFYYRIGAVRSRLIGWYCPGDRYFTIAFSTRIGSGLKLYHPYSTIVNADVIGKSCSIGQCTTIGITEKGRPSIGDNVRITANCVIVGPVHIGNNVIIGAGSVVVKDIPDNSVAVGNPARAIKSLPPIEE